MAFGWSTEKQEIEARGWWVGGGGREWAEAAGGQNIITINIIFSGAGRKRTSRREQRVAYRIGNFSNADISDFFVYRIVYRIEPPISSISILIYFVFFRQKFSENSKNSPEIRKISGNSENSSKFLKIHQKFLQKKVFFEAQISYRIVSYREKNPHIVSISYRIEKKLIATQWSGPSVYHSLKRGRIE